MLVWDEGSRNYATLKTLKTAMDRAGLGDKGSRNYATLKTLKTAMDYAGLGRG